jgi:hypothetical protein
MYRRHIYTRRSDVGFSRHDVGLVHMITSRHSLTTGPREIYPGKKIAF